MADKAGVLNAIAEATTAAMSLTGQTILFVNI